MTGCRKARILRDNERCHINILGVLQLLSSLQPTLSRFLFFMTTELLPAAACASDCNRNSFVNYRILRDVHCRASAPRRIYSIYLQDDRDHHTAHSCTTISVSCRTYFLTLDTVPSIQRYFFVNFTRHNRTPREYIDTHFL